MTRTNELENVIEGATPELTQRARATPFRVGGNKIAVSM